MTKYQTYDQLQAHAVSLDRIMSRAEKLNLWADLVERSPTPMHLYHGLEYARPSRVAGVPVYRGDPTAFALALAEPRFQAAGLIGTGSFSDVAGCIGDIQKFFDLSQADLHTFCCDCGGGISNSEMADRIRVLASRLI